MPDTISTHSSRSAAQRKTREDFRTGSPSQGGWEESGLKKNIQEVERWEQ
jgi:hypothetical protein